MSEFNPVESAARQAQLLWGPALVRGKLLGAIVCATVGLACGWAYAQSDDPFRFHRDLVVGGLGGGAAGGLLAGRRFGRPGWGAAAGLVVGATVGLARSSRLERHDLEWAVAGYLAGFAIGLLAELFRDPPPGGSSPPLRDDDLDW
jgi:hypothetical protein